MCLTRWLFAKMSRPVFLFFLIYVPYKDRRNNNIMITTSFLLLPTDLLVIILSVHYQLIKSIVNTAIIPPSLINHTISPTSSLDIHPPHTSDNITICSASPSADVVIVVVRGKYGVPPRITQRCALPHG